MTKLKLDKGNTYTVLTAICALILTSLVCFFLRNSAIGCHDSFGDFVFAREHSIKESFIYNLEFNLARGRVGILFSLVSTLRFAILKTGNIYAIWLLQQVPTWATVGLIAWMIGKKTRPVYGIYFACFFAAFVQIDTNHNLMVCYPLDFVYGIAMMSIGFYLYDSYLSHKGEKKNVLRMVFSVFCYYETMLCYESFITTCLGYGFISLAHSLENQKQLGKKAFSTFITDLIPHAVSTIVFYTVLNWVKAHPIIDSIEVTPIDDYGSVSDFIKTWCVFANGVFPFTSDQMVDGISSIPQVFDSSYNMLFSLVAAISVIALALSSKYTYKNMTFEQKSKLNRRLLAIGTVGFIFALFFTVPHALTRNYQNWVIVLKATGYLTSSMCYFGWAVALSCFVCLIVNMLSNLSSRWIYYAFIVLLSFGAFVGAEITVNVNNIYSRLDAASGIQMSYRGQLFYAFVKSDYAKRASDLLYVPDYAGIHEDFKGLDEYADYEMDRDVMLERNPDAVNFLANYYGTVGILDYFPKSDAGYYALLDNPLMPSDEWICSTDIVIVSTRPGIYEVSYTDVLEGQNHTFDLELGRLDTGVINEGDVVDLSSLTISYK